MEPVIVKVTEDGKDWIVKYIGDSSGQVAAGKATVEGNKMIFRAGAYGDDSSEMPHTPKITSQERDGKNYIVKLQYAGKNLGDYFNN